MSVKLPEKLAEDLYYCLIANVPTDICDQEAILQGKFYLFKMFQLIDYILYVLILVLHILYFKYIHLIITTLIL